MPKRAASVRCSQALPCGLVQAVAALKIQLVQEVIHLLLVQDLVGQVVDVQARRGALGGLGKEGGWRVECLSAGWSAMQDTSFTADAGGLCGSSAFCFRS